MTGSEASDPESTSTLDLALQIVDGEPRSRCYFHAQHVRNGTEGGSNYVVAGIYRDRWVRTEAGWRSCERSLEVTWTEGNPAVVGA